MFTSRAEHRLLLREDNAYERLTPKGRALGLVSDAMWKKYETRKVGFDALHRELRTIKITPTEDVIAHCATLDITPPRKQQTLEEMVRRPELSLTAALDHFSQGAHRYDVSLCEQVEIEVKYAGYLEAQAETARRLHELEDIKIPVTFSFDGLHGISNEVREKLSHIRPHTLGQAARISGITPAAVAILMIYLKR